MIAIIFQCALKINDKQLNSSIHSVQIICMEIDGVRRLCHRHKYIDENDNCTTALFKLNLSSCICARCSWSDDATDAASASVSAVECAISVHCSFFGDMLTLAFSPSLLTVLRSMHQNAFLHKTCILPQHTLAISRKYFFFRCRKAFDEKKGSGTKSQIHIEHHMEIKDKWK